MLSTETNSLNLILMKIKMPAQTVASRSSGSRSNSIVKPQGVFAIILALMALLTLPAHAGNVFLRVNDAAGTSSVTGSTNWNPVGVPSPGNTYFTTNTSGVGLQMRTPTGLVTNAFAGGALVLCTNVNGESLIIKGDQGSVIIVTNLIMAGGSVANGGNAAGTATTNTLAGFISVVSGSRFNSTAAGRAIVIVAAITNGVSPITNQNAGAIWIFGTNNGFTGKMVVNTGCTLRITNQFNLGGNQATFTAAQRAASNSESRSASATGRSSKP